MDFPQFPYNPLRPQTTIAIDQVNTTNSDTQPSVKIAIALLLKLFTKRPHIYHTGNWLLETIKRMRGILQSKVCRGWRNG